MKQSTKSKRHSVEKVLEKAKATGEPAGTSDKTAEFPDSSAGQLSPCLLLHQSFFNTSLVHCLRFVTAWKQSLKCVGETPGESGRTSLEYEPVITVR